MKTATPNPRRQRRGLTLIEAMVLMVIVSIVAVAAGVGLQAVAKVPATTEQRMAVNNALVDTLEQWKARSWPAMNPSSPYASPYSVTDTVTVNGSRYSRTVTVTDADPASPESGGVPRTDFRTITVTCTPYIGGSLSTQLSQTLRCYATSN